MDRHVNAVINKRPIPPTANNDRYPSTVEQLRILKDKPWNLSEKEIDMIHPSAKSFLIHHTKKGRVPVQAQIGVWFESMGIVTRAEQIWINLKTGRDSVPTTLVCDAINTNYNYIF